MFPLPEVQEQFKKLVLVRLYTDKPENAKLQDQLVKTAALPTYAVLSSSGTVVEVFPGSTPDGTQFADFIKRGIAKATTKN